MSRLGEIDADTPAAEARRTAFERLLFFSDAVFAIAITLLVLPLADADIHGDHVGQQILDLWPKISAFGLSFIVIGVFWLSHHSAFQEIVGVDAVLVPLNMAFLLCIVFMPFPTQVLGATHLSSAAIALYAGTIGATGAVSCAMWWWASHDRRLVADWVSDEAIRTRLLQRLSTPTVFLLTVPVAYASPRLAMYLWVLVYPASLIAARLGRRSR